MGYLGGYIGVDLATGLGTNFAPRSLPFADGSHTNASTRYLRYGGSLNGPFAANVPATCVIAGRRYIQLEQSDSTTNANSQDFSSWARTNITVSSNYATDPVGALTADKMAANTTASVSHFVALTTAWVNGQTYAVSFYIKAEAISALKWVGNDVCFPAWSKLRIDTVGETVAVESGTFLWSRIVEISPGYYCVSLGIAADASVSIDSFITLIDNVTTWAETYAGVIGEGLIVWGYNTVARDYETSHIVSGAVPATRAKDQFKWTEAVVNAGAPWMRTRFKARLIMHQGTDEMLAADGGEKYVCAFDATASIISIYFDGADKKLKWKNTAGALGESVALNWSFDDTIDITFTFDNGSNSTLKVVGGGVDATYTAAQTAAVDGDVYWGMDDSEANQAGLFLVSEPEPL